MSTEFNVSHTSKFLSLKQGCHLILSLSRDGGPMVVVSHGDPEKIESLLRHAAEHGLNLYIETNSGPRNRAKKTAKHEIERVLYRFVDLDVKHDLPRGTPADEVNKRLSQALSEIRQNLCHNNTLWNIPEPTFFVATGGGYNLWYRLPQAIDLGQPGPSREALIERIESSTAGLHRLVEQAANHHWAATDGTHDITRIGRLPGSLNVLNAKKIESGREPKTALLIHSNADASLSLEGSESICPEPNKTRVQVPAGPSSPVDRTIAQPSPMTSLDLEALQKERGFSAEMFLLIERGWSSTGFNGLDPDLKETWQEMRDSLMCTIPAYPSRSEAAFAVASSLGRQHGCTREQVVSVLLCKEFGISDHLYDQPYPVQYANRQYSQAVDLAKKAKDGLINYKSEQQSQDSSGSGNTVSSDPVLSALQDNSSKITLITSGYRCDPLYSMISQTTSWLTKNEDIYLYNRKLARWSESKGQMDVFTKDSLLARVSRGFDFATVKCPKGKEKLTYHAIPPSQLTGSLMDCNNFKGVRAVDSVLKHPSIDREGNIYGASTGYCAKSRSYYQHSLSQMMPDAEESARILFEPFREFAPKSWIGAACAVFSQLARPFVGRTPIHYFKAAQRGSGKTLLATITSMIVQGSSPALNTVPNNRDEFEKILNGCLLGSPPLIVFDDAHGFINSPLLNMAMTGDDIVSLRPLGTSNMETHEFKSTIFLTGNNLAFSEGLSRRVMEIDVSPDVDKPTERDTDRSTYELEQYVLANRSSILSASLSWMKHCSKFQYKRSDTEERFTGFDEWRNVVYKSAQRLVLKWIELGLASQETPFIVKKSEPSDFQEGLKGFLITIPKEGFQSRYLEDPSMKDLKHALSLATDYSPIPRVMGQKLRRLMNQRVDGMWLVCEGSNSLTKTWKRAGRELTEEEKKVCSIPF